MTKILARTISIALSAAALGGCVAAIIPALFVTGVGSAAYIANDRRAPDTMLADQRIQKTGMSRMEDELKNNIRVDVRSYNRNVLLLGEARTEEIKQRAGAIASGIDGVRNVYNELAVSDKLGFRNVADDVALSTEIKARLVGANGTDPLNIHVSADDGVVYLQGMVTHREADEASRVAAATKGVKRVVRVFEYTPDNAAQMKTGSTATEHKAE
jgi:osmotically-inducible protein OsmY